MEVQVEEKVVRHLPAVPIVTPVLPFLATRVADFVCFEYLPVSCSPSHITLLLPDWAASREILDCGSRINLHLNMHSTEMLSSVGEVAEERYDSELGGQLCFVKLQPAHQSRSGVGLNLTNGEIEFSPVASTLMDTLVVLLQQSVLAKRALRVYLKHLVPLFGRIGEVAADDYAALRIHVWDDIAVRVQKDLERLVQIFSLAPRLNHGTSELIDILDPVELRTLLAPVFPHDLLEIAFPGEAVRPYIRAINIMETKLLTIHNIFVVTICKAT